MCEIAIIDPREYQPGEQFTLAMELYERMRDGLGLCYVKDSDDGLEYTIYKDTTPDENELATFIEANHDSNVRAVIHSRLKTHGEVSVTNCHPLKVECDECDVDYVAHNGVLRNHVNLRRECESAGHDIETQVDSELLAHQYGSVPTDFEGYIHQRGQPAYILMNSDAMYVYSGRGYTMAEDGQMARATASIDVDAEQDYQQFILRSENA